MQDFFPTFDQDELLESLKSATPADREIIRSAFPAAFAGEFDPEELEAQQAAELSGLRGARIDSRLPTLVLLHGITDCHLATDRKISNRIWLDFVDLIRGRFTRDLTLQTDGRSDQPHIRLRTDGYLRKKYQPAINSWQRAGFPVEVVCYDWRKSVFESSAFLDTQLRRIISQTQKPMVLVGHSMGGVVAATWASQTADWESLVRSVVFVGSPLAGSYSAAEAIMGYSESFKKMARFSLSESLEDFQRMGASFPGLIDLLPSTEVFPEAADLYTQAGWPGDVIPQQEFLDQSRSLKEIVWNSPVYSKGIHLISTNRDTLAGMPWNESRTERRVDARSTAGDGTVLNRSSQPPNLPFQFVPGEHGMMLTEAVTIEAVMEIARSSDPRSFSVNTLSGLAASRGVSLGESRPDTLRSDESTLQLENQLVEQLAARYGSDATHGAIVGLRANTQGRTFDRLALRTTQFTWQNALSMAIASERAYLRKPAEITSEAVGNWGFHEVRAFDVQHTQGFVAWDDEVVLLAYRGTELNFSDWLRNINVPAKNVAGLGRIHSGFYNGFDFAQAIVRQALKEAQAENKKLWITGHSLGGALSVIAGAVFRNDYPVVGVYTFGQPKLAVHSIQNIYNNDLPNVYQRFVNDLDVVPRVPPGYVHFGNLTWFDEHGQLKASSDAEALSGLATRGTAPATQADDTQNDLTQLQFEQLLEELDAKQQEFELTQQQDLSVATAASALIDLEESAIQSALASGVEGPEGLRFRPRLYSIRQHSIRDQYIPIISQLVI